MKSPASRKAEISPEIIALDDDDDDDQATMQTSRVGGQTEPSKKSANIAKNENGTLEETRADIEDLIGDDDRHSETASFKSDPVDPAIFAALVDEEDNPSADFTSSGAAAKAEPLGTTARSKPYLSSGGGFSAMKQDANGQYYTGMGIGMSHTWNYNPGVWKETKKEPE